MRIYSTQPGQLGGIDSVILAPAPLSSFHPLRIGNQHFMSKSGDHFPYPRRMRSHFDNHTRNRQALKELSNFLPPRPKLALGKCLPA